MTSRLPCLALHVSALFFAFWLTPLIAQETADATAAPAVSEEAPAAPEETASAEAEPAVEKTPSPKRSVSQLVGTKEDRTAPLQSEKNLNTQLLKIPAPRGLIIDRYGEPLAQTRAAEFLSINVKGIGADSLEEAITAVEAALGATPELAEFNFSVSNFTKHWEHRPFVLFPLSGALSSEKAENLKPLVESSELLVFETMFVREYPGGITDAHIVGYTNPTMPFQHGPLADPENLWPPSVGKDGLELVYEEKLKGKAGLASYIYSEKGELRDVVMVDAPVPGDIVVTTLNRNMQELAYETLKKNKRPGALVAVDSVTGDILAMASYPSFDPNLFVGGISQADYKALTENPANPMYPRAARGEFPPGSAFKPFVALAAMDIGVLNGDYTRLPSPPALEIDGRIFRNWHDGHEGLLDVRYGLLRSSNTFFYQVGIATGGIPILRTARTYGFGSDPGLPIKTSSGNLPETKNVLARQAMANTAIGQGEILVSPLQLAVAMGGLSIGTYVPKARLIIQTQDPATGKIKDTFPTEKRSFINSRLADRTAVRTGMWGVVNHERGTGRAGFHDLPQVYGKTGTSQWRSGGEELNLAWFAGYVGSDEPRIAFTALVQGDSGETLSGGKHAAPLIADFVEAVYADTEKYRVKITVKTPANPFADRVPLTQSSQVPQADPVGNAVPSQSQPAAQPVARPATRQPTARPTARPVAEPAPRSAVRIPGPGVRVQGQPVPQDTAPVQRRISVPR